ncbi:MAG TPA: alginate lyase family protein [Rhodanobacteraceae bacterium]|nr:alginate lyase family protein [Rhodanobacteraceae bacterium]
MNARRVWHTLRWLRPVQWYGRAWFRLYRPRPNLAPAPPLRPTTARWQGCARAASLESPTRMRFLGVSHEIATAGDWNRPDWPKLWLYNAHYFDDLAADDAAARRPWQRELIERWIAENPPPHGNGWEPYPLSLRIVNWLAWMLAGNPLSDAARHSLAVQTRYLRRRLEHHLLGNHLWANAKALVFAGVAHRGPEADAWRGTGLTLIARELDEQVLPDGGHFERSPMYHAIVLGDLLDLLQLARGFPGVVASASVDRWRDAATRMLGWLRTMTHPDGQLALFNDTALGIAATHAALADYARRLDVPQDDAPLPGLSALRASGYVRLQAGPAVLIADVGEIGPDYLPGHAHADTLSFELSLFGQRLLVNAGTSTYAAGTLRLWQRGTRAKNTVEVDGVDSSEVWGSFRVARRARPLDVRHDAKTLTLDAAHDGYRRLPGTVTHHRRWQLTADGLHITDLIEGRWTHAVARYRFAPGVELTAHDDNGGRGSVAGHRFEWRVRGARAVRLQEGRYYPGFGREEIATVLELEPATATLALELIWST